MKKQAPIALLAAGRIRDSFLRRIPNVAERLGPVASTSLRLASRIVNILAAGVPVDSIAAFAEASVVLISVPDNWLAQVQEDMVRSELDWKGKTILLFDSRHDSGALDRLAAVGAYTGSITVSLPEDKVIVVEGCAKGVREARKLTNSPGFRVLTMSKARKDLFSAGVGFATGLALPLLAAGMETLRASGIDQSDAIALTEKLFQRTLRSYLKAGRKGWEGALPAQDKDAIRRQVQALTLQSPLLASYYFENALKSAQLLRQDPGWIKEMEEVLYQQVAGD